MEIKKGTTQKSGQHKRIAVNISNKFSEKEI